MTEIKAIHDALRYEPETGLFYWKQNRSRGAKAGKIAGTTQKSGYIVIGFCGKYYKAHRLAWLMTRGEWPSTDIDHINRDPSDNRICNLRECTSSQNQANRSNNKNNSRGYRGVTFHKKIGRYQAAIRVNRKPIHLGTYDTALEAFSAYERAARERFGVFTAMLNPSKQTVDAH